MDSISTLLPAILSTVVYYAALPVGMTVAYWYGDDMLRVLKWIFYQYGRGSGHGKGPIPGPSSNTRFSRFSDGDIIGEHYRHKYGALYRVFCGAIPEIVLTDSDDVRKYYQGDAKVHLKTFSGGFGHYMGMILGFSAGYKHGDDWKRIRSHTDIHFTNSLAKDSLPTMIADTASWLETLPCQHIVKRNTDDKDLFRVESADLLGNLPFTMVARRLFGDALDEELLRDLCSLNDVHERIVANAFLWGTMLQWKLVSYLPLKANYEMDWFQKKWTSLLHRAARSAKERSITTAVTDMYDAMQAGNLSFLEFSHTADEILFTNIDVTSISVSWAITLIAQHPDIQSRLVAEIHEAVLKTNTLLHYCYLEAGRLRPILYWALPEVTSDAKVLSGYHIPPRTSVIIDAFALNRYSPVWGDDGDVYRPERFAELSPTDYRYSFWRFGIGPRKCVGIHFGDKIIKCCVFMILEKFKVTAEGNLGVRRDKWVQSPAATLKFERRIAE